MIIGSNMDKFYHKTRMTKFSNNKEDCNNQPSGEEKINTEYRIK
jgi:hypothetical protein